MHHGSSEDLCKCLRRGGMVEAGYTWKNLPLSCSCSSRSEIDLANKSFIDYVI